MFRLYEYLSQSLSTRTNFPFTPTFTKADLPLPSFSVLLFENLQSPRSSDIAKMKLICFFLPLVSLALADSQIKCPCSKQDCSKVADSCACENKNIVNKYFCCDANTAPPKDLGLKECESAEKSTIPIMPHGPKDWLDSFFSSHSQQSTSTAASTAYKTSTLTVPSSTSSSISSVPVSTSTAVETTMVAPSTLVTVITTTTTTTSSTTSVRKNPLPTDTV